MHDENHKDMTGLLHMLENKDGLIRKKAREALVQLGTQAVMPLSEILIASRSSQTRWAAAKALGELVDPRSAPALVQALEDKDSDVSWLAAVALEKMGQAAWRPLLIQLVEHGVDSVRLREGAHHVLAKQKAPGFDEQLDILRQSLEFGELTEAGSMAATEMLRQLRAHDMG